MLLTLLIIYLEAIMLITMDFLGEFVSSYWTVSDSSLLVVEHLIIPLTIFLFCWTNLKPVLPES